MSRRIIFALRALSIWAVSSLCLVGCVRDTPVFKKLAEEQGRRAAKFTAEALKESPVLRELDHLCQEEIPLPDGFKLLSKDATYPKRTFMTYFYQSGADYGGVKSFYNTYFIRNGWRLTEQYDGGWGPKKVEYRKDDYRVVIYHEGLGGSANYALHCEKVADPRERNAPS